MPKGIPTPKTETPGKRLTITIEAAGITPTDDAAELAELARWLPIAYADAGAAINGRTVVED